MDVEQKDINSLYKDYEWNRDEVNSFISLENGNKNFARLKYICLGLFIGVVLYFWLFKETSMVEVKNKLDWELGFNFETFIKALWTYFFVHFISFILHEMVFRCINRKASSSTTNHSLIVSRFHWDLTFWLKAKRYLSIVFTPDYFWANQYKDKLERQYKGQKYISLESTENLRLLKKYFIERSNWINLIFTIFLVSLSLFLFTTKEQEPNHLIQFFILFVSMRIISRSLEIIIAFYNDVLVQRDKIFIILKRFVDPSVVSEIDEDLVEKRIYINSWKNSHLMGYSRASLAIHSLVEIVLIFSVLYLLLDIYKPFGMNFSNTQQDIGIIKYFLFSFTSSVSFPTLDIKEAWAIPQALQLLTSLVLIIMAFAYYLGKDNKLLPHQREFYKRMKIGSSNKK